MTGALIASNCGRALSVFIGIGMFFAVLALARLVGVAV